MKKRNKNWRQLERNRIKVGGLVKSNIKGWFGKVFAVESLRFSLSAMITVATICTADGRPHRKPYRKRVDSTQLEVVEALPERFNGSTAVQLPDGPGGTPRKKFTDYFRTGDRVYVHRYEHGWNVGCGVITKISDYHCQVRLDNENWEIYIERVRNLGRC